MSSFTSSQIERATQHDRAGWTVEQIRRLIFQEFGVWPAWSTVKRWVDPAYADMARHRSRETNRMLRARRRGERAA